MKKIFALAAAMLMAAASLQAGPARRKPFTVKQADGTELTLRLVGDEHFHYYTTADGIPVCADADGTYRYARLEADRLVPTAVMAHDAALRGADEAAYASRTAVATTELARLGQARRTERNEQRARRNARRRANGNQAITGEKKGLVILVNFSDKKMAAGSTQAEFNNMMNQKGYSKNGNGGSVHDYFLAQSYGQFSLTFDVVGPVTLSNKMSYYGGNDEYGNDLRPGEMAAEACMAVKDMVNFADYDWDGDGEVEQVYIVYAGYGEASGAAANTIWPHEWELSSSDYGRTLTIDGVTINTYACSSELYGTSGTKMDGIGTTCHEFSHCLGLPDLYDTAGNGNFGMDSWSVMDYGSYNGDGYVPCGYTSYERMFAGWVQPTVLDRGQKIADMQPIASAPEAYIIYNDANRNEYYLLENRQLEGWDREGYGHGLLILHVDYDASAWYYNTVNNTSSHQRLTIVPADNQFMSGEYATAADLAGDPWPGTKKNTSLTDTSRPAATLFTAGTNGRKYLGKPIENIVENANGLISFTFMGGVSIDAPVAAEPTGVGATGFTARWNAVEGAESYTLEVRERNTTAPGENLQLSDDFRGFASESKDGSTDISAKLDSYMQQSGWTGSKLFASPSRIKMGSSKQAGTLVTPTVGAPATGSVTVSVSQDVYGTVESTSMTVKLLSSGGTELASQSQTIEGGTYVFTFDGVDSAYKIGFYPAKRIYISGVQVYNGEYTADELASAPALRAAAAPLLFEGLTDTSYAVEGLNPESTYAYRVKAVTAEGESAWSNTVTVPLLSTGITTIPATDNGPAEIYTADGRLLRRVATVADWSTGLPSGTYIVRQGEKVSKYIVR